MSKGVFFREMDGSAVRIGIVTSRWNSECTFSLRDGVLEGLAACNVPEANVVQIEVPGAYEVIAGARHLIANENVDAVVCLGVLVNGETDHYEYISQGVTSGIAALNATGDVPVMFGILMCQTEEQAEVRSVGEHNHGPAWGQTAVEMALLRK